MGIDIKTDGYEVFVSGRGMRGLKAPDTVLYTGNSGTTTRLLTGLLAAQSFDSVIDGDDSIRTRPMDRVIKPLSMMGADIIPSDGGRCPLRIKGKKLNGIEYTLPVPSAQVKSAVILAGLYADGETVIIENIKSRNHTELMLGMFGSDCGMSDGIIRVRHTDKLNAAEIDIPGDISSAAFFMVAGLLSENSEIILRNVGINPTRSGIITVLRNMGGDIMIENIRGDFEPSADIIVRSSDLSGTEISGDIIPSLIDEIPAIAAAAAFATGKTVISGASELKHKETDRIKSIVSELKKANVDIFETADGFIINGGNPVRASEFDSFGDHRIAMAMSVLALNARGTSVIKNHEACGVSYPGFYEDLFSLTR
jgi:3-phosphoshikimate 1-carboxyvinyltransferase